MARILIVEDEVLINNLISEGLSSVGYQCRPAFDGEEALAILNDSSFDLTFLT